MNLGTSLNWVARRMGDKVCLIENNESVSFSELWENIELLAHAFLKIGIKEDSKIVLMLPNSKEFIYGFYALARINAISIPLNQSMTSHELKNIFDDCRPDGIITASAIYRKKIEPIFKKDKLIITIDEDSEIKGRVYDFEGLLSMGAKGNLPSLSTSNSRIATINYTYRGLGEPLGAVLTHGNYHFGAMAYVRLTEFLTGNKALLLTPMSHIFTLIGCVIVSLLRGATIVIMKNFIPSHVFKAIEEHAIDFVIAVPTIYVSLLKNYDRGRYDISSLKRGITGGSYMPLKLHREIREGMGIELFQGYGLTETVPVTCNPQSKNKPESLGVPGRNMKIEIADEKGNILPRGERGEIIIGGRSVMKGYYKRNGENKRFLKDGWFYSGDYGWIDEEGYVYFGGLKKEIVKVGGNNVDLNELKATLKAFKGVRSIKLEVKEDELWGHRVNAEIGVEPKSNITEKAVKSFCSERLATYKIPRNISIIEGRG